MNLERVLGWIGRFGDVPEHENCPRVHGCVDGNAAHRVRGIRTLAKARLTLELPSSCPPALRDGSRATAGSARVWGHEGHCRPACRVQMAEAGSWKLTKRL